MSDDIRIAGYWARPLPSPSGRTAVYVAGVWQITVAYRALCHDGKVRTVRVRQSPDTFFSHPGRVTFGNGRTVRGYVSVDSTGEFTFTAYRGEKP